MHCSRLSLLSLIGTAALAASAAPPPPIWGNMLVKHMWNVVPANWECLGHPPAGTTIDLSIALEPQYENALIDTLYEVSDPRLPKYGAHLSREQVAELVAPHPDTLRLVHSWLEHSGVSCSTSTTHGGGWLTVTGVPVSQANDLLGASYQLYRHSATNKTILRTIGYALPAVLHAHVQTVAPTTHFSSPRTPQQTPRIRSREEAAAKAKTASGEIVPGSATDKEATLEFLRWLYKTRAYVPAATDRNALGIAGYDGEFASQEDLTEFMELYRVDAQDATFTVVQVNGGEYDPKDPGEEASLNIQYAEGMAYPTPHIFYSIGGKLKWLDGFGPAPGDSDFEWLNYLLSQQNIPQTISISYGFDERTLPRDYATTLCNLFAQLGTRGVSVLFASGNNGVGFADSEDWDCLDPFGKVIFNTRFPAACPWVTSVGGTTSHGPEVAASLSGGGFSYYFPRPKYQNRAVTAFLKHLDTKYDGFYNADGRGFPDIAAQAANFKIIVGGKTSPLTDGTSFAAPTVASIISLLNDYLLASGKAPLGFLNPWLYGLGRAGLNDVTSGSNPGCDTDGFSAIVGWDPVTGLGTPDFVKLQQTLAKRAVVSSITVASHSSTSPTSSP